MDLVLIGKNIREKRVEKDLTLAKLAEKVGISTNFMGQLERGDAVASVQTLVDVVNALDVGMDYILDENLKCPNNVNDDIDKQLLLLTSNMNNNKKQIMIEFGKAIKKI